jgi:hypothetical protein
MVVFKEYSLGYRKDGYYAHISIPGVIIRFRFRYPTKLLNSTNLLGTLLVIRFQSNSFGHYTNLIYTGRGKEVFLAQRQKMDNDDPITER